MKTDDAQRRLRSALRAEEERIQFRLAADHAQVHSTAEKSVTRGAVVVAPMPEELRSYDAHIEGIQSRYRKIGYEPTRDQVIRAGLLALDHLPGAELRKLMQAIPGVRANG